MVRFDLHLTYKIRHQVAHTTPAIQIFLIFTLNIEGTAQLKLSMIPQTLPHTYEKSSSCYCS